MPQRWTKIILALLGVSMIAVSCGKKSSSDNPLPATYLPSIIIGNDNQFVYAFDPAKGTKNWEINTLDPIVSAPLVYGSMVYIFTQHGFIIKAPANNGKVLTNMGYIYNHGGGITGTPVVDGKFIYVPSGTVGNDTLYAIDTGSLAVSWKFGYVGAATPFMSSPVIYKGQVLFGGTDGKVYALDKTAGTLSWSYNAGVAANFMSSMAVADSFGYIGGMDNKMYCINLNQGTLRWAFTAGGQIESSPSLYHGRCIFGCDDWNVYCLDTNLASITANKPLWVTQTKDRVISSPCVYNQVVYAASYDYNLYALDIAKGKPKWQFATHGLIKSSPVAYGSNIYVGSADKYVYAVDTGTGSVMWQQNTNGIISSSPVIDDLQGNVYNSAISGSVN